ATLRTRILARPSSLDIPVSATPICNNASGGSEGGIGAILLALSSLKHLKSLQAYTYFLGTGGTVTFRARDGEAELTGTYSQRVTGSPVHKPAAGNEKHPLPEARPMLFGHFELKAMIAAVPAA
ncbi:hypothetical protein, partial [Shewanella algae]|uniref:hypothetical protein n=1 Tax=Shewanella algae TaxID=38313 RepID=UPI000B9D25DF